MATVAATLREAARILTGLSDTPRLDVELLMADALGVSRSHMLIRHQETTVPAKFVEHFRRRRMHEPVAYIVGSAEFYGLELCVAPGVLIPRGDSETLIEAVKDTFAGREHPSNILDLGTGSGALLLAALTEFPDAAGHATDRSEAVIPILTENIRRHGKGRAIAFELADWRKEGWADGLGSFDLILCNPPYVESDAHLDPDVRQYEPASALFAGEDGLDDYRILLPQLRSLMSADAVAILEMGHTQAEPVTKLAEAAGFAVEIRNDLANRPRCAILR